MNTEDEVREALIEGVKLEARNLMRSDSRVWHEALESALDKTLPGFWAAATQFRPRATVTEAARMEYTIAAESSNGAVTQLADYTTVVRDHLKADLYLFRQEEERLKGDPDRIFIAERPIPKWVRS